MKTTLRLFFLLLVTTQLKSQSDLACKELFFSEINRHDTLMANGKHYGSYSFELFNPTPNSVSLYNYQIDLRKINNQIVSIKFKSGTTIASKSTYVVTNSNAETSILALSDRDTTLLDSNQFCEAKLNRYSAGIPSTIDVFGQPTTMAQVTFNYLLFMQNPTYYATTYGFSLSQLNNIDIRRSFFVQHGISTFNSSQVFGTWAFYYGADISDLKHHKCMCNRKIADLPVVGYKNVNQSLDELYSYGDYTADIDLQWSADPSPILVGQGLGGFTAVVGTEIQFSGAGSSLNTTCYYNSAVADNCTSVITMNNAFTGVKQKNVVLLAAPNNDYSVDNATGTQNIVIFGNKTTGIKEQKLEGVKIYPSVTSDLIYINAPGLSGTYNITNTVGQWIKSGTFENENKINVSALTNEMYFINFIENNGHFCSVKFIKI